MARAMRDDVEHNYLQGQARVLTNASENDRRRIRREAADAGTESYIQALENAIETVENEKQALLLIIAQLNK